MAYSMPGKSFVTRVTYICSRGRENVLNLVLTRRYELSSSIDMDSGAIHDLRLQARRTGGGVSQMSTLHLLLYTS